MNPSEEIRRVQQKLQQLIDQHHLLYKEKLRLEAELKKSQDQLQRQQLQAEGLEQQLAASRLSGASMSDDEKREIEKKINQYIKEIDRCIAQLGNG